MKKFATLLYKEIRELLTPQMLVPFLIMMLVFTFVGKIVGKEQEKQIKKAEFSVIDYNRSALSQTLVDSLKQVGFTVTVYTDTSPEEVLAKLKSNRQQTLLTIPKDFEKGIREGKPQQIGAYTVFYNFSLMSGKGASGADSIISATNELVSSMLLQQKMGNAQDVAFAKQPVVSDDIVVLNGKQAHVSPAAIFNFMTSQVTFIPIALFLVITFASQLVATAIAVEKENKTLETLLSCPIDRRAIVAAKLLGAGIVSLLMAVLYMYGMKNYMSGLTGPNTASADVQLKAALETLGLVLKTKDYIILGFSLFSGILVALSTAFILGSFAEDSQSAQSVIAPIMILLLLPYMLTMFLDVAALSLPLKILLYALPFTHTFLVMSNLLVQNYSLILYGNVYLWVLIIIGIYVASRIFTSEKILTLRLRLGRKR